MVWKGKLYVHFDEVLSLVSYVKVILILRLFRELFYDFILNIVYVEL